MPVPVMTDEQIERTKQLLEVLELDVHDSEWEWAVDAPVCPCCALGHAKRFGISSDKCSVRDFGEEVYDNVFFGNELTRTQAIEMIKRILKSQQALNEKTVETVCC